MSLEKYGIAMVLFMSPIDDGETNAEAVGQLRLALQVLLIQYQIPSSLVHIRSMMCK